jgi:hypothetical protein
MNMTANGSETITVEMLFGESKTMLVFAAVVCGLGLRTIWEYNAKRNDGTATYFDKKFFATAIAAFVGAGLPAIALMGPATAFFESYAGAYGLVGGFLITMIMAYGGNHLANFTLSRIEKHTEKDVIQEVVVQGKLNPAIEQKVDQIVAVKLEEIKNQQQVQVSDPNSTEIETHKDDTNPSQGGAV